MTFDEFNKKLPLGLLKQDLMNDIIEVFKERDDLKKELKNKEEEMNSLYEEIEDLRDEVYICG